MRGNSKIMHLLEREYYAGPTAANIQALCLKGKGTAKESTTAVLMGQRTEEVGIRG